uniref:Plastid lipid-associated protein/fibrillin conserved domain-containing protein n=1 Tax=Tetradesmus obliquus TaxID=3088 RepID=A0A383WJ09_TETOB|eukprot:jgi/Sobl393_1/17846/SZX77401.1
MPAAAAAAAAVVAVVPQHLRRITGIHITPTSRGSAVVVTALPGLGKLFGGAGRNKDRQKRAKYTAAAEELLQLLTTQQASQQAANARANELVEVLLTCEGLPFQEQLLGPGPWLVFFTKGSPQLWKATFSAGKLLNASNAASQDLDPGSRAVVNRAEYFGRRLYVTASGTYEPLDDDASSLPAAIQANISSGLLHVLGLDIPLPIKGTGQFEVVWLDTNLRVFRSSGAVSVQIRQQYLADAGLIG